MEWYINTKTLTLCFFLSISDIVPRDISMKDKFIEHFTGKQKPISIYFMFFFQAVLLMRLRCVTLHPALFRIAYYHITLTVSAEYIVCIWCMHRIFLVIWPATFATRLLCGILYPTMQCTRPDLLFPVSNIKPNQSLSWLIIWLDWQMFRTFLHKIGSQKFPR